MAEKILVPLDGSSYSEAALEYLNAFIGKLSPEAKVSVILFQVVNMKNLSHRMSGIEGAYGLSETPYDPRMSEKLEEEAKNYLEHVSKSLRTDAVNVKCKVVVGYTPAEEIIKAEQEMECNLVVMATHGRSGLSRWAFGSVTDKVLRAGTVPVLLVRTKK